MRKNELNRRAKNTELIALDGDGVLFPNDAYEGLVIDGVSLKPKTRSHYDGQGISFLRGVGIKVCVITNAEGMDGQAARELVDRWNSLPSTRWPGCWSPVELLAGHDGKGKQEALEHWVGECHGSLGRCAVMGNDIGDYYMLRGAGLSACPIDAEPRIRKMCHFVADRTGGHGAVRDLCNLMLEARGIDPTTLPLK